MSHDPNELDSLLSGLCDDDLADVERTRLAELLRTSPTARVRYLEWVELHADLVLEAENSSALETAQMVAAQPLSTPPLAPMRPTWVGAGIILSVGLLAVSVVMFVGVLGHQGHPQPSPQIPTIGEVTHSEGAVWADPESSMSTGQGVFTGPLELRAGRARMRLTNGVELVLDAPLRMELVDPKSIRLHFGNLVVRVPDDGIGFRVTTPKVDVVDLGTEFGVAVEDNGATEIHVAEGVVVARSAGSSGIVPIVRHEAGRVDTEQSEIVPVTFDLSRFPIHIGAGVVPKAWAGVVIPSAIPMDSRLVFLGDETVSRETSLLLLSQAFSTTGLPDKPRLYNSGLAFPLFFKEADYQRYVARFTPTHAVLVFGPEVAWRADRYLLTPERFRSAVLRIVDRLQQDGIEPILATGYPLDPQYPDGQRRLDEYNRFLRKLAHERGYRLADIESQFRSAAADRRTLLVPNGREPSFEGHQEVARALLAALGRPNLPVADSLDLTLLPGVLREWRFQAQPKDERYESTDVADLQTVDWEPLMLPQPIDQFSRRWPHPTHSAVCRERLRGFANNLVRGGRERLVAASTLEAKEPRDAVLNVGGTLYTVWLNGEKVFDRTGMGWRGQHAGFERVPVRLQAGKNTVVVEAHGSFFVSITDEPDWPIP